MTVSGANTDKHNKSNMSHYMNVNVWTSCYDFIPLFFRTTGTSWIVNIIHFTEKNDIWDPSNALQKRLAILKNECDTLDSSSDNVNKQPVI